MRLCRRLMKSYLYCTLHFLDDIHTQLSCSFVSYWTKRNMEEERHEFPSPNLIIREQFYPSFFAFFFNLLVTFFKKPLLLFKSNSYYSTFNNCLKNWEWNIKDKNINILIWRDIYKIKKCIHKGFLLSYNFLLCSHIAFL